MAHRLAVTSLVALYLIPAAAADIELGNLQAMMHMLVPVGGVSAGSRRACCMCCTV